MSKTYLTFKTFILGLVVIFLQGSLLRNILPDFLIPNLIVSIVVFLAFYENSPYGAILAFLLGIEIDLYGGNPLLIGPSAGALVLLYGILASVSTRVYLESKFAVIIMSILSNVFYSFIFSLLIYEFNDAAVRYFSFSLSNSLVTGVITPFLFIILSKIYNLNRGPSQGAHTLGVMKKSRASKPGRLSIHS